METPRVGGLLKRLKYFDNQDNGVKHKMSLLPNSFKTILGKENRLGMSRNFFPKTKINSIYEFGEATVSNRKYPLSNSSFHFLSFRQGEPYCSSGKI